MELNKKIINFIPSDFTRVEIAVSYNPNTYGKILGLRDYILTRLRLKH